MEGASVAVGHLVRSARHSRALTQTELAELAGTTQAAISRLEQDHLSPTVDTLQRVLAALGMRLTLAVEPVEVWADEQQIAEAVRRTPAERIDHAVASMRGLADLVGAARRD